MPKVECPGCHKVRLIRMKAFHEAYTSTGNFPLCGECRTTWKRGRPQTTGKGTKQIPCPKCGKTRWARRIDANKKCRDCKPKKKKPAKPTVPILTPYGPADWKITYPCCRHKLITNTKKGLETCPQCGTKHKKVVKAEK